MKKITLLFIFTSIFITSCGDSLKKENESLKSENEALTLKIKTLTQEIEDLKFGAEKILSEAKLFIENKELIKAKTQLQLLLDKHPGKPQSIEAERLMIIVDENIKDKVEAEEKAKNDRLANATKKLRSKYDDMQGLTWYYDKGTTKYSDVNSFHLYMSQSGDREPTLRFRIQYTSSDWLFIESYLIKTDNNSYTITPSRGESNRDNGSGVIWEWYDVLLNKKTYDIVKDIISSKNVKIRHIGKQYYNDRTISEKEKTGLKNILDAYEALGGTFEYYK